MIQIFISINNNEEVIQLPVSPPSYDISSPFDNEQTKGLQQTLKIIGTRGLKEISISSFFPAEGKNYPFDQNKSMFGESYVNKIEQWRDRRYPIRLVIVESGKKNVNLAVTIDKFECNKKQDGDTNYTLEMTEFPFVSTNR